MHGALTVLLGGIVLLVLAGLRDRQTRRRAERAALEQVPPVPGLPDDEPTPQYVAASDPALLRRPAPLTPQQQRMIDDWCANATGLDLQLADDALATHLGPATAVLHDALVLVCSQGIGSMRELLPTAERAVRDHRALLVATTTCSPDVVDTLRVNLRAGRLASCVVLGSPDALATCASATGAEDVSRTALQSGAPLERELGHAPRMVSTTRHTWVGPDAH